ncbi:hypothetical protein [Paraburkholderia heleia]|uniref:hypothetical protein n=1 Tax=Paraburkholderia heleia TaxID=634127 RepID=UPI002AB73679|nr:hypothetical protein [Paraburkholderia heleia]
MKYLTPFFRGIVGMRGIVKPVFAELVVYVLLSNSASALAQITQTAGPCDANATSCSQSTQSVGNPATTSTATNSTSTSSQSDTSANQNGNTISPVVTVAPQDNMSNGANTNEGNSTTANGGTGGSSSASGNLLTNGNTATIGNTTTGPSTSSADNNSNSGGNVNSSGSGNVNSAGSGNVAGGSNNGNTTGGTATTNSGTVSGGAGGSGGSSTGGSIGSIAPAQNLASKQGQSSRLNGGNQSTSTSNQNGQNIGTGNTTVNANTNSTYKAIYIPPVVPPTPASQLAIGNIVKETLACGPMMKKTSTTIEGTYFGLALNSKFEQGHDDVVEPVLDASGSETYDEVPLVNDPRGEGFHRYGSQVVMFTAIVGLAGARNIAIGAGSAAGGWGQGGLGGSGSIQQMVTTVQIVPCDLGTYITRATDSDVQALTRIHG